MRIACIYTVDSYFSIEHPLVTATEIPFGISMIITVLQQAGHEVDLLVITPDTNLDDCVGKYIIENKPQMFGFTAVSTQYWQAKRVAEYVRRIDPTITLVLGGHHASLNTEKVAADRVFNMICVGEGESAIVELANNFEGSRLKIKKIAGLWVDDDLTGDLTKNPPKEFQVSLDDLPLINRKIWDDWISRPHDYPSLLLGRGCPFKCTYCANHAMAKLSEGKYVRFRSPENIVSELEYIRSHYRDVERVYLEVETFGANRKASYAIFDALAEYNQSLVKPLKFGVNLALTSSFMKNKERIHETLGKARAANLVTINIGLESGSERMRKDVLIRPKYTNEELIEFCTIAKTYGIHIIFFVLMGLPEETIDDYMETVRVARAAQPLTCYVSIFFPYLGTDLATHALQVGLVREENLSPRGERTHTELDLPGFSRRRIRFEYIVFWWRVYWGYWSYGKIFANISRSIFRAHPKLYSIFIYFRDNNVVVKRLADRYGNRSQLNQLVASKTVGTRVDVVSN